MSRELTKYRVKYNLKDWGWSSKWVEAESKEAAIQAVLSVVKAKHGEDCIHYEKETVSAKTEMEWNDWKGRGPTMNEVVESYNV